MFYGKQWNACPNIQDARCLKVKWMWKNVFFTWIYMKNIITFIIVSLETGTNFPAVSVNTLLVMAMMSIMLRWNSTGVPTQSQLHAASLTLSPWNITTQIQGKRMAIAIYVPAWGPPKCRLHYIFYVKIFYVNLFIVRMGLIIYDPWVIQVIC